MLAYSSGVYNTLKFIHLAAAIAWVGGGAFVQVYATRVSKQNDPKKMAGLAADLEVLGKTYLTSASLLVFVAAVALVAYAPQWNFTDTWILIGIGGYAATLVTGAGFIGPEAGRLSKLVGERGPEDPEVQRRIRRIFAISRIDIVVLTLVILDMVFKPGS